MKAKTILAEQLVLAGRKKWLRKRTNISRIRPYLMPTKLQPIIIIILWMKIGQLTIQRIMLDIPIKSMTENQVIRTLTSRRRVLSANEIWRAITRKPKGKRSMRLFKNCIIIPPRLSGLMMLQRKRLMMSQSTWKPNLIWAKETTRILAKKVERSVVNTSDQDKNQLNLHKCSATLRWCLIQCLTWRNQTLWCPVASITW